ncbi:MAG: rRNA processing protein RimM [Bryobacterales bacterium]|nr:rRNA processing protein RimM [Bryobacterales bacterium]
MNNQSTEDSAGEQVTIAILGRPRGNRGELTASYLSSKPERYAALKSVTLSGGDAALADKLFDVEKVWDHGGTLVLKFAGVDSISDAEKLRGAEVRILKADRVELEPGEYFHSDLVGCEVRDRLSDRLVGHVTGWEEYGGPALLEIDDGRLLIPFVAAICTDIRPDERVIRVDLPEGLEAVNEVPPSNHLS